MKRIRVRDSRLGKRTMPFTDLGLRRLNVEKYIAQVNRDRRREDRLAKRPKRKPVVQCQIWDEVQTGLSVLVGGRAKTFRATFKLNGEWVSYSIGRFGEMAPGTDRENVEIGEARKKVAEFRGLARQGIDPRPKPTVDGQDDTPITTYEQVVDHFITHWAKPRQRTWDQTERVLNNSCKGWLGKPIANITKGDARTLLRGFIADGHPYKAAVAQRWLKKLWKWAYSEDLVPANIMDGVNVEIEKRERDRVYSTQEIKNIWKATQSNHLSFEEGAYVKLLMLLAPRKTALAYLQRSHLDDADDPTVWTVPQHLVKMRKRTNKKRVYVIPLPPLARRIVKQLLTRNKKGEFLFPSLPRSTTKAGSLQFSDSKLKKRMKLAGAPKDYYPHAWRHTIATFLHDEGHSEWERGMVLNHSEGGTVTAGYSHGNPLELKRTLLKKWSDHVEGLVTPAGVQRLG